MSAAKRKGSQFEKAVADYLAVELGMSVERRVSEGANDRGDLSGLPGVVVEAKNQNRDQLGVWVTEAEREALNDGFETLAIVAHKRRGKGDIADNYFTMPGWAFVRLLRAFYRSR